MGIDLSSVNVRDLALTRPDRSGPGGDQAGAPEVLGQNLAACHAEEDKIFRRPNGREVVSFGRFFLDPLFDEGGDLIEVRAGDLAQWTSLFGVLGEPQEIISVEPTADCDGKLDILSFRVGRT